MAYYRANYRKNRIPVGSRIVGGRAGVASAFAASPAGNHRRLALNAFRLAKVAGATGNLAHQRRMIAFGKRALALSKAEIRLWKKGVRIRAKAFAAQRRAVSLAQGYAARPSRFGFR